MANLQLTPEQEQIRQLVLAKAREVFPGNRESQDHFEAIAFQESSFDPAAHNTVGENSFGIFQFGPALQRKFGLDIEKPDAIRQINAAGEYVPQILKANGGNWDMALREYNLGAPVHSAILEGGERAAGQQSGKNDFDTSYKPTHEDFFASIQQRDQPPIPAGAIGPGVQVAGPGVPVPPTPTPRPTALPQPTPIPTATPQPTGLPQPALTQAPTPTPSQSPGIESLVAGAVGGVRGLEAPEAATQTRLTDFAAEAAAAEFAPRQQYDSAALTAFAADSAAAEFAEPGTRRPGEPAFQPPAAGARTGRGIKSLLAEPGEDLPSDFSLGATPGIARQFAGGLAEGGLGLLNLASPTNPVLGISEMIGEQFGFDLGSAIAEVPSQAAEAIGGGEPETVQESFARTGGEFTVAGGVPAGLIFRGARALPATANLLNPLKIKPGLRGLPRRLVRSTALEAINRPARFATVEGLSIVGATAGAERARPPGGVPEPLGALMGALGLAMGASAAGLAIPVKNFVANIVRIKGFDNVIRVLRSEINEGNFSQIISPNTTVNKFLRIADKPTKLGQRFIDMSDQLFANRPKALAEIEAVEAEARALLRPDSPFALPIGQATRDPGALALERGAAMTNPHVAEQLAIARGDALASVRTAFVKSDLRGAPTISLAQDAVEQQTRRELDVALEALDREIPGETLEQMSKRADDAVHAAERKSHDVVEHWFLQAQAIAEAHNMQWGTIAVRRGVGKMRVDAAKGKFGEATLPKDLMRQIQELKPVEDFVVLVELRKEVNRQLVLARQSAVTQPASMLARQVHHLEEIKTWVMRTVTTLEDPEAAAAATGWQVSKMTAADLLPFQEVASAYQKANAFMTTRGQVFREGITKDVLKPTHKPSSTLRMYSQDLEAMEAYKSMFRDKPEMIRLMEDFQVEDAFQYMTAGGTKQAAPAQLGTWIKQHRLVLEQFPRVRDRVKNVATLTQEANRIGVVEITGRLRAEDAIRRAFIADPLKAYAQVRKLAEATPGSGPNPRSVAMKSLLGPIRGNEAAMNSMKRHYWDSHVIAKIEDTGAIDGALYINSSDLRRVLGDAGEREMIAELYGPEELGRLERLSRINQRAEDIPTGMPARLKDDPTEVEVLFEFLTKGSFATQILALPRRGLKFGMATFRLGEQMTQRKLAVLFDEAVTDTELQKILLSRPSGAAMEKLDRWITANMPTLQAVLTSKEIDQAPLSRAAENLPANLGGLSGGTP